MKILPILFCLLVFAACGNEPQAITDTTDIEVPAADTSELNDDKVAIFDADADTDDPYMLSNGYFLGMTPGGSLADYIDGLRAGEIRTGEGEFEVLFIDAAEGDELGYVYSDEINYPTKSDDPTIDQITITSPKVVTEKGVRVGLSFTELTQRLGTVEVYASEIESRVYATKDGITYRLNTNGAPGQTTAEDIDGDVTVMQIILGF